METWRYFDGHPEDSCLFTFESAAASYIPLRREPRHLKPSDSAPIFEDCSGLSYDILAKILGVNSALFLLNAEFYFPLFSLLVRKSHKSKGTCIKQKKNVANMRP
jgi:hypothetical protein